MGRRPTWRPAICTAKNYESWIGILGTIAMYTWYSLVMKPTGVVADQHGWYDPELQRMWLRAARAKKRVAAQTWRDMSNRIVTQAYNVPILGQSKLMIHSKRVRGVVSTRYRQGYENA